jgi:hypothetical protein
MKIDIQTIPHSEHRYPTVGDYWVEEGVLRIRVSEMKSWKHELLVIIHELIEYYLTMWAGIQEPAIKAFDEQFERERDLGLHPDDAEPGDDPRAPYRREHRFAENIERMLAWVLRVDWDEYAAEVMAL